MTRPLTSEEPLEHDHPDLEREAEATAPRPIAGGPIDYYTDKMGEHIRPETQ